MKKKVIIVAIVVVVLIGVFCLYNYLLNPLDEVGYRCQTLYNQKKHKLITGEEIDILDNSCFVADCCMYTSMFRTKMSYEELKEKARKLEKNLNEKYPKKKIRVNTGDGKLYRTYSIFYEN